MTMKEDVQEGSCCCGRVRFRLQGPFGSFTHCHCIDCRKSHGAAFATYLGVGRARFRFLQGENEVADFTTETGTRRSFCRLCGSSLTGTVAGEPDEIYVAAAALDTTLLRKPEYHIFIRSKVPWLELHDGLPQYREFADSPGAS